MVAITMARQPPAIRDGLPWHRHASATVGDGVIHRVEVREVVDTPQVGRRRWQT